MNKNLTIFIFFLNINTLFSVINTPKKPTVAQPKVEKKDIKDQPDDTMATHAFLLTNLNVPYGNVTATLSFTNSFDLEKASSFVCNQVKTDYIPLEKFAIAKVETTDSFELISPKSLLPLEMAKPTSKVIRQTPKSIKPAKKVSRKIVKVPIKPVSKSAIAPVAVKSVAKKQLK